MSRFKCDPHLTGNLTAEYEALQNDLEQAKLLSADYQNQLNDKANAYADLKFTLEKTVGDLEKLQSFIVALRTERHSLANEVMKVVALEAKLARAEEKIKILTEELAREREESKRLRSCMAGGAGKREDARREQIQVGFEEPDSMEIIATPRDPKPYRK